MKSIRGVATCDVEVSGKLDPDMLLPEASRRFFFYFNLLDTSVLCHSVKALSITTISLKRIILYFIYFSIIYLL